MADTITAKKLMIIAVLLNVELYNASNTSTTLANTAMNSAHMLATTGAYTRETNASLRNTTEALELITNASMGNTTEALELITNASMGNTTEANEIITDRFMPKTTARTMGSNTTSNTENNGVSITSVTCNGDNVLIASIAFFAVGGVLFLATIAFWLIRFCKKRRQINKPLPHVPAMYMACNGNQTSGEYIDLQDSVYDYESIEMKPGDKKTVDVIRYVPRDAMHETFDGSRMPSENAPNPPNYQLHNVPNRQTVTASHSLDETDAGTAEMELTYEVPDPSRGITNRSPTTSARRQNN